LKTLGFSLSNLGMGKPLSAAGTTPCLRVMQIKHRFRHGYGGASSGFARSATADKSRRRRQAKSRLDSLDRPSRAEVQ
jgi:hypothetical protein